MKWFERMMAKYAWKDDRWLSSERTRVQRNSITEEFRYQDRQAAKEIPSLGWISGKPARQKSRQEARSPINSAPVAQFVVSLMPNGTVVLSEPAVNVAIENLIHRDVGSAATMAAKVFFDIMERVDSMSPDNSTTSVIMVV